MKKLSYVYLFFLAVFIVSYGTTFGMDPALRPLKFVEREIFLQEVKRVGIESIFRSLARKPLPKKHHSDVKSYVGHDNWQFKVELKLYCDAPRDTLAKIIFEAIALKKQKDDFTLEQIAISDQTENYLGDYTKYSYHTDQKGLYVQCVATFTQREVLEDILDYFIDQHMAGILVLMRQADF